MFFWGNALDLEGMGEELVFFCCCLMLCNAIYITLVPMLLCLQCLLSFEWRTRFFTVAVAPNTSWARTCILRQYPKTPSTYFLRRLLHSWCHAAGTCLTFWVGSDSRGFWSTNRCHFIVQLCSWPFMAHATAFASRHGTAVPTPLFKNKLVKTLVVEVP